MPDPTSRAQPVFVLGLGAQKCGTTWLHRYIEQSGIADFGLLKEYHVWDALTVPACGEFRVGTFWLARQALAGKAREEERLRWRLQRSPDAYFAYFADLATANAAAITGDITPSYCALPAPTLVTIRDEFAARGLNVRPAFLMRDPVDRCWSQLRMLAKKGRGRFRGIDDTALAALLPEFCRSEGAWFRTDYPATLERLAEVFPAGDVHVGFFETMFTEREIARLSAWLGIPSRPELGAQMIHSGKAADLPADIADRARTALEPIYRRCNELYPETKSIWRGG